MERPLRRAFLPVVIAALVVAACAQESTVTPAPTDSTVPSAVGSAEPSSPPAASGEPAGSPLPSAAVASEAPQPTDTPSPSPESSAAGADCSGSLDNRTFFEAIAGQVDWGVYCAVLPDGWFVQEGNFVLRDGGHMEITYKGPNGALLTLQEGNVCTSGVSACSPKDHEIGPSPFGDRDGTLVTLGDGQFAVYVDPGVFPSWSATGKGLDQATFASLVQALHRVSA